MCSVHLSLGQVTANTLLYSVFPFPQAQGRAPPPLLKRLGSVTMWMIHSKYPDSPEKLDDGLLAVPHVGTEDLCPAHREERGTYIGNRANIH